MARDPGLGVAQIRELLHVKIARTIDVDEMRIGWFAADDDICVALMHDPQGFGYLQPDRTCESHRARRSVFGPCRGAANSRSVTPSRRLSLISFTSWSPRIETGDGSFPPCIERVLTSLAASIFKNLSLPRRFGAQGC